MKLFKLECTNEDGNIECNGYFLNRILAESKKLTLDSYPANMKYGIKQIENDNNQSKRNPNPIQQMETGRRYRTTGP